MSVKECLMVLGSMESARCYTCLRHKGERRYERHGPIFSCERKVEKTRRQKLTETHTGATCCLSTHKEQEIFLMNLRRAFVWKSGAKKVEKKKSFCCHC